MFCKIIIVTDDNIKLNPVLTKHSGLFGICKVDIIMKLSCLQVNTIKCKMTTTWVGNICEFKLFLHVCHYKTCEEYRIEHIVQTLVMVHSKVKLIKDCRAQPYITDSRPQSCSPTFRHVYCKYSLTKSGNVRCRVVADWFDEAEHENTLYQVITDFKPKKCLQTMLICCYFNYYAIGFVLNGYFSKIQVN